MKLLPKVWYLIKEKSFLVPATLLPELMVVDNVQHIVIVQTVACFQQCGKSLGKALSYFNMTMQIWGKIFPEKWDVLAAICLWFEMKCSPMVAMFGCPLTFGHIIHVLKLQIIIIIRKMSENRFYSVYSFNRKDGLIKNQKNLNCVWLKHFFQMRMQVVLVCQYIIIQLWQSQQKLLR